MGYYALIFAEIVAIGLLLHLNWHLWQGPV